MLLYLITGFGMIGSMDRRYRFGRFGFVVGWRRVASNRDVAAAAVVVGVLR